MKYRVIAAGLGSALAVFLLSSGCANAQKIIRLKAYGKPVPAPHARGIRVRKFGRLVTRRHHGLKRFRRIGHRKRRFRGFALPDQHLFPPYYAHPRPWSQRPDMTSRIEGGKTVQGGSPWGGRIAGGKTVQGGSRYASRIRGGASVQGGSRYASHIAGGRTVEQGSRWRSHMPNRRFSGHAAPMRPAGLTYFRAARRTRSPWAGRF